jgi:hypothetical protein
MPKIIGISGKKRSGKDECCNVILDMFPGRGERIAFADALKSEVGEVCGVSLATLEERKPIFRTMLQWWGTEFRRQFCGPDSYWIDRAAEAIAKSKADFVVIPDVRFPNELKFVRDRGGLAIRIESDRANLTDSHSSETSLDSESFDLFIQNHSTLQQFHQSIQAARAVITSMLVR